MARAWQEIEAELLTPVSKVEAMPASSATVRRIDWRKRMSDNIAYALLVYTALQIFVTMSALKSEGGSLLPYLALIILVAAIIPSCRSFERRWNRLSDVQAADPTLSRYFRRDRLMIWALAIGLPFAITAMFRLLGAAFS
jgi:hypothetical protein